MIKIIEFSFESDRDLKCSLTSVMVKFRFPKLKDRLFFIYQCLFDYEITERGIFVEKELFKFNGKGLDK